MIVAWTVSQRGVLIPDIVCISFSIHISVIFRVKERGSKIFTWKFRNLSMDYVTQHVIIWPNENIWWFKPLTFIYKSKPNKNFFRHLQFFTCKLSSGGILFLFPFKLGVSENWRADVNRQQFGCGTLHIVGLEEFFRCLWKLSLSGKVKDKLRRKHLLNIKAVPCSSYV